ncbi:MAG: argininosuccinate lyase, partial [Gammaproteobacteria bacterium]|nr:argininosuccinate lyase [Gammaproteobacteria bacterium]
MSESKKTSSDNAKKAETNQSWGGRFNEPVNEFVARFTASVSFDQRLFEQDIKGSIAHATMLAKVGVLSESEKKSIIDGLNEIGTEIRIGNFEWSQQLEDVHMNIESALTARIGDVGKKLHTGRSRNDQVATDIRLWLRDQIDEISILLTGLQKGVTGLALAEHDTIMPGFTHLQTAQPVTFGHHLLAWNEMLERDFGRLLDCRKRLNQSPLGAAALAGTTYPIDRVFTANQLGFDRPSENSLDSVSDRDFAIEFCAFASLLTTHMSRMSEELILWASAQFQFIDLPDRFCTGSSIMPQKKNPDVPELVRGKTGRVTGHLISLLTLMKSQPLAYNKDNQEDKEPLFDTVDTVQDCLRAFADMIPAIESNKDKMYAAAKNGFSTATDLADYLVRNGIAFRDAHEIVGKAVAYGIEKNKDLSEMTLKELNVFS